jgi:hypothetical protein
MAGAGYQVGKGFSIPASAINPVSAINNASLSTATTGGTVAGNTTYYFKYTMYTANGETLPHSSEASIFVPNTTNTNTITLTLPGLPNSPITIVGFNVYVGTSSGNESYQGSTTGSSFTLTSFTQGRPLPAYNTTSYVDVNPSALGAGITEFILHNVCYNAPMSLAMWDGTTLVPFDSDSGAGARMGMALHCNASQWLRVYNGSATNSLQFSVGGIQTV